MACILVADDRPAGRELIRSMLESVGYDVVEAENGVQVLVRIQEAVPDLVILDLQMPLMDGFEVVRQLRARPEYNSLPVVALTASAMQGDRERALSGGFSGYMAKPIRLAELRAELERFLTR